MIVIHPDHRNVMRLINGGRQPLTLDEARLVDHLVEA